MKPAHILLAVLAAVKVASVEAAPLPEGTTQTARAQSAIEAQFDSVLSGRAILERLRQASSAPSPIGSPHDRQLAEQTLRELRALGWDARIETVRLSYPFPVEISLELPGERPFRASVTEPPVPGDSLSHGTRDVLPAYLVYGAEGDVSAPLVYVNYGLDDDYAQLERMGVSVRGKIVIARFGGGWRGLKPKLAQAHGAVGCILYSDPADDGYAKGDPYPQGPWRPAHSFQRGSVLDLVVQPGDPLATASGEHIRPQDAPTVMKIPVIPISGADAQHFLAALEGPAVSGNWRGALPLTYHIGPGPAEVHMHVHVEWRPTELYNVVARIAGSQWPDQWVIRGNNRDTWVYGAWDSLSGHTVMLEEARSIGALLKTGWRPKRTLVYVSWDGEEPGLLGSTAWTTAHAKELQQKAVLYVNSGPYSQGTLDTSSSYALVELLSQVAGDVRDPEVDASIRERSLAALLVREAQSGEATAAAHPVQGWKMQPLPVGDMGAGSDFTPFLQHLGIASMDLGFRGAGGGSAVAHSIYDDYPHFERFSDPRGEYGVALAKVAGRVVLRTADADILPLEFTAFADRIHAQLEALQAAIVSANREKRALHELSASDAYALVPGSGPVPAGLDDRAHMTVDLGPLQQAADALSLSAGAYQRALAHKDGLSAERRAKLNRLLQGLEQRLLDPQGLPGRPWYRHLLYEPSLRNGYAASTLPLVREALDSGNWPPPQSFIGRTADVLNDYRRGIDAATKLLTP